MSSVSRWWFNTITNNFLIYNSCWEDPAIDRNALQLDSSSEVLMITSAGDNALSYLLDSPASIDCVDINFRQNALMEFKLKLFESTSYAEILELFGDGRSENHKSIYYKVRNQLSEPAQHFWDSHIQTFAPSGKGFYYSGLSGYFARIINRIIDHKKLRTAVNRLINEPNINERKRIYSEIESTLWSGLSQYFWKWNSVLTLAGIPKEQKEAIGDLNSFMSKVFHSVFVDQQANHNYFWLLYLNGCYKDSFLPDYLCKSNFDTISANANRISTATASLADVLENSSKKYTHFILLDHMDWLATNNINELCREWEFIIKRAKPNAKVLFRSAYPTASFLPSFVHSKLIFSNIDASILKQDRVGTYSSTHLTTIHV
ncbi:MAG: BtaA family protein [Balneolaceae bacterium]